jgi:putative spermidine/putrescine transport system ATP-binding protein
MRAFSRLPGGRLPIRETGSAPAVVAMIRAESIGVGAPDAAPLAGMVDSISFAGDRQRLVVSGKPITINAPNTLQCRVGERIGLLIAPEAIRLLPSEK